MKAIREENLEVMTMLIDYANDHNILLDINDKDFDGNFPLLVVANCDDTELSLFHTLVSYANDHNILLNINDKNNEDCYPLLKAAFHDNDKVI